MELSGIQEGRGDLLDLLESRVDSLVAEIQFLRRENAQLREDAAVGGRALKTENSNLKRVLTEAQQLQTAMLKRMEGILARTEGVVQDKP